MTAAPAAPALSTQTVLEVVAIGHLHVGYVTHEGPFAYGAWVEVPASPDNPRGLFYAGWGDTWEECRATVVRLYRQLNGV
jgi:hypothetical protein